MNIKELKELALSKGYYIRENSLYTGMGYPCKGTQYSVLYAGNAMVVEGFESRSLEEIEEWLKTCETIKVHRSTGHKSNDTHHTKAILIRKEGSDFSEKYNNVIERSMRPHALLYGKNR